MPIENRHANKKLRILVVEDEALIALLLESMLGELGYAVLGPIAGLDEAVKIAKRGAIDAAILDVNINGNQTYAVAAELAARGIPFVFATGYDAATLPDRYRDRPMLQKPFLQADLQKVLVAARK